MVNFSNIPTSSQWITFPVSAKDQVTINWEDGRNKYVNTYHVAKCYYGILKDLVPAPEFVVNEKLQVPNPVIYKGQGKLTVLGKWIDHIIIFKSRALAYQVRNRHR